MVNFLTASTLCFQMRYPYNSESVFEAGQDVSLKAKADISSVRSFLLLLDLRGLRGSSISVRS